MKCGKKWQDILQNVKYFMLKYFFLCIFRDTGYRCDVQQPQPHHLPRMHGSVAPTPVSPHLPPPPAPSPPRQQHVIFTQDFTVRMWCYGGGGRLLTYFFWLFKQITATSLNRLNQN